MYPSKFYLSVLLLSALFLFTGCGPSYSPTYAAYTTPKKEKSYFEKAVEQSNVDSARLLISQGRVVDIKAMEAAVLNEDLVMVQLFVEEGRFFHHHQGKEELLQGVYQMGNMSLFDYLLEHGASINKAADLLGTTLLMSVAAKGDEALFFDLVNRGADIHAKGKYGSSVIASAAQSGNKKIFDYLLKHGVDIHYKGEGSSVLFSAVSGGNMEIIEYLIGQGMSIHEKNSLGWSLLTQAATGGKKEVFDYLVKQGLDIHAEGEYGTTLLMSAAQGGNADIFHYLVGKGLDINKETKYEQSVYKMAAYGGNLDIIAYLLKHSPKALSNKNAMLESAILAGKEEAAEYLKSSGAVVTQTLHSSMVQSSKYVCDQQIVDFGIDTKTVFAKQLENAVKNGVVLNPVSLAKCRKVNSILAHGGKRVENEEQKHYYQALKSNTKEAYEKYIARYPQGSYTKSVKLRIDSLKRAKERQKAEDKRRMAAAQQAKLAAKQKQESIKRMHTYLEKGDIKGLYAYMDKNPKALSEAKKEPKLSMLFIGPSELSVGRLLMYSKQGINEKILISKINGMHQPYKQFSMDEIMTLGKMGVNDNLVAAMIDVTTKYESEERSRTAVQQINTPVVYDPVLQPEHDNLTDTIIDAATEKAVDSAIDKGMDELMDRLF